MKKGLSLVGLLLSGALIVGLSKGIVFARASGADDPRDPWCMGVYEVSGSRVEVCVDATSNLIPTADNTQSFGSASLAWATGYFYDIALSDDLTVADDATVTGDLFKVMAATQTVALSGTIDVSGACGGILRLTSTTDVTVAGFTAPSSANAGCILHVINVATPGGGNIDIATSATFKAPSGGVMIGANPGVRLGTADTMIVGNVGAYWVVLGTYAVIN